jgi:hypothetical protein
MAEINRPNSYSEWCQEEAKLLDSNFLFKQLFKSHANVSR